MHTVDYGRKVVYVCTNTLLLRMFSYMRRDDVTDIKMCKLCVEFAKHKTCLREKAGSSAKLVPCAKDVTEAWRHIYNLGNNTDLTTRVDANCR